MWKKYLFILTLSGFFFFNLNLTWAEETTTVYGPYSYGSYNTETILIPADSDVYIASLQTDSNYNNYLDSQGFFVGSYAGRLKINDIFAMHEANAYSSESSGYDYTTYYYKSVYETSGRYREASTDYTEDGYSSSNYTKYRSEAVLQSDERWMDITDLINLGEDNTFSFMHSAGDGTAGYIIKTVTSEDNEEEEVEYNTDFNPDDATLNHDNNINGTGFQFDNFSKKVNKQTILDAFHLYDYNLLRYSDWKGNYYWKWEIDNILDSFNYDEVNGKCFGFNFSAWDFYQGYDEVSNYKTTADTVFDISESNSDLKTKIKGAYYFQYAQEFNNYYKNRLDDGDYTISNVYTTIKTAISNNGRANYILGIYKTSQGGHSLTPYRLVESADGDTGYLYVYDSNYAGAEDKYILFEDLNSNPTWQYEDGDYNAINGDGIYYYKLSDIYDGSALTLPGQNKNKILLTSASSEVPNILITDADGYSLGYDSSGTFYDNISEAFANWDFYGASDKVTSFTLPADGAYTINVSGTDDFDLNLVNQKNNYKISGSKNSDSDQIVLNDNTLSYILYGSSADINMQIAKKSGNKVYEYNLSDVSLDSGSFGVKINSDKDLSITNGTSGIQYFDLQVKKETLTDRVVVESDQSVGMYPLTTSTLDVKKWKDLANSNLVFSDTPVNVSVKSDLKLPRIKKANPKKVKKSKIKKKKNYSFKIIGKNFKKKSKVKVGGKKVKKKKFISSKKIKVWVNLKKYSKGYYKIKITNPNGKKVTKFRAFRVR